jgi:DNA mismatch endonuclease, patch repair protein
MKPIRPREHRGDIMSPEKRSALMSRIKGRDTGPEKLVAAAFRGLGLSWDAHAKDLPGRPDFVFRQARLAVFVDGDFWHGWRFPSWRHKLSEAWEAKLEANLRRDQRNRRRLRRQGWQVIRIWEHQIERNFSACVLKIQTELAQSRSDKTAPSLGKGKTS